MVQKYYDDSKDPQVGGVYRTRGRGAEFAIATIVIWQRVEILFTVAGGGLESKVYGWADFKEKWEPAPFDFQKCWDQLNNRFKRKGGTERAEYLLAHFDPAREQPVGEPSMATAKKTTPKVAPAKTPSAKPAEATTKKTAAKPETKAAPKKTEAPVEKATVGRKRAYDDSAKIKVLVEKNPKRGTAAERFDLYAKNNTVGSYLAAGGLLADIRWDVKQGFIEVL